MIPLLDGLDEIFLRIILVKERYFQGFSQDCVNQANDTYGGRLGDIGGHNFTSR